MAKLSPNQVAAVEALKTALNTHGVTVVDKNAWKKAAAESEATVTVQSLVKAGAVSVTRAQIGARTVELYGARLEAATSEVGG